MASHVFSFGAIVSYNFGRQKQTGISDGTAGFGLHILHWVQILQLVLLHIHGSRLAFC